MNWKFFRMHKAIFDANQNIKDDLVEEKIFLSVEKREPVKD